MPYMNEPYPNIGYVLNRLADIADTKALATNGSSRFRKEEDFSSRKTFEPAFINDSIHRLFYQPIEKVVSVEFAQFFSDCILMGLQHYIELIKRVPMEAISQKKVTHLLNQHLVVEALASIIWKVGTSYMNNDVPGFYVMKNPIQSLLAFYESQNTPLNNGIKKSFEQNVRTINKWLSGEEIPKLGQITLLASWASKSNPETILDDKEHLFLARFVSAFHKKTEYQFVERLKQAVLWRLAHKQEPVLDIGKTFHEFYAQEIQSSNLYELSKLGNEIHQLLKRKTIKPAGSYDIYKTKLKELDRMVAKHGLADELGYHSEWLWGRLFLLSGEVERALVMYLNAVESSLYKSGGNIRDLLKDALAIAAIQGKPHKPTMKKLKSRALTFFPKIIEPEHRDNPVRISDEDIDYWQFQFAVRFPSSGWFEQGVAPLTSQIEKVGLSDISSKVL